MAALLQPDADPLLSVSMLKGDKQDLMSTDTFDPSMHSAYSYNAGPSRGYITPPSPSLSPSPSSPSVSSSSHSTHTTPCTNTTTTTRPAPRRTPSRSKYDKATPLRIHQSPTYASYAQDPEKGCYRPLHLPLPQSPGLGGLRVLQPSLRKGRIRTLIVCVVIVLLVWWNGVGWDKGRWRIHIVPSPADIQPDPDLFPVKPEQDETSLSSISDPLLSWGMNITSQSLSPDYISALFAPKTESTPHTPAEINADTEPEPEPEHDLGPHADSVYTPGPSTWPDLYAALSSFIRYSAPSVVHDSFESLYGGDLDTTLAGSRAGEGEGAGKGEAKEGEEASVPVSVSAAWDDNMVIWQIDKDAAKADSAEVNTWKNGDATREGWKWELVTDEKAKLWIHSVLKDTVLQKLWTALPSGILRSDYLRYLLLALHGGIYTDTDTNLLKPPSAWVQPGDMDLWQNGKGWLPDNVITRISLASSETRQEVIQQALRDYPVGAIVGIEADVGGRRDWADWWPRPLQIAQWTMSTAPLHPISLLALQRIAVNTAKAADWSRAHAANISSLYQLATGSDWANSDSDSGSESDSAQDKSVPEDSGAESTNTEETITALKAAQEAMKINALSEPKSGGPLGIVNWTGPGVWTDAVLIYLKARYGVKWTDLRGLERPLRVGDVVVLPVTGFSPGVGNFGAKSVGDPLAMVEHSFRGSWKTEGM